MKSLYSVGLLLTLLVSCQKKEDTGTVPWSEALKETAWGGEYENGGTAYKGSQSFSIVFNSNGTFIWYEVYGDYPGTWTVKGDQLIIEFSSGSKVSGTLTANSWTNVINITGHPWKILSVYKSSFPQTSSLDNTNWTGKYAVLGSYELEFLTGSKVREHIGATTFGIYNYVIKGSAIRWVDLAGEMGFGVLDQKGTTLNGYHTTASPSKMDPWQVKL